MAEPTTPEIRTSAKAVILHDSHVLLMRANWDDQACFSSSEAANIPESLDYAVHPEVHEETGLTVTFDGMLWLRKCIGANHDHPVSEAKTHRIEAIFLCIPISDPTPTRRPRPG
ncbi:hypothetical protein ACWCO0_10785 [Streptomyces tubercidicus]